MERSLSKRVNAFDQDGDGQFDLGEFMKLMLTMMD